MSYRKRFCLVLATIGVVASTAAAQQTVPLREVFTSDSLFAAQAQISPNGKWVALSVVRGSLNASLWLAPVAGGPPVQLTSDGHNDRAPIWFASGDRISFASTRPNRNGGRQLYLMTLAIDPTTGRAIGAPRQVSSEPVGLNGPPSPDGRWLVYSTAGSSPEIKVVPVSGGTARVVGSGTGMLGGPVFSPDNKFVYYTEQVAGSGARCAGAGCSYIVRRVALAGGASTVLAKESHPVVVLRGDPRYFVHFVEPLPGMAQRVELRSLDGKTVGGIDLRRRYRFGHQLGDGLGFMVLRNDGEYSIRMVPVTGGPLKVVTAGGYNWLEAWMPDGSAIITDKPEGDHLVAEVLPLAGGARKQVALPRETTTSGWSTSFGPWFSYVTSNPRTLGLVNVTTGATRTLSRDVADVGFSGRGGMEQDGSHILFAEPAGGGFVVRSTDPETGETSTIRDFPTGMPGRARFHVHGSQLAWFETRGDSLDLMLTTGPSGSPRRLAAFAFAEIGTDPWERLAWSWKGDRLAVCRVGNSAARRAVVTLIDATTAARVQEVELGGWSQCWNTQWLPDDSGLLTLVTRAGTDKPDILKVPLRSSGEPVVLTQEETNEMWEFLTSPDGRQVAYPVNLPNKHAYVYVADFKPLLTLVKNPK